MWSMFESRKSRHAGRDWVADGATLLDVRTREEFASGHVHGAQNIPVQELHIRVREVDAAAKVVVYCRSGGRSAAATQILRNAGYEVLDIGGMSNW